jgi:hypothetical protein
MCCVCGGGSTSTEVVCEDTAGDAMDGFGDGCDIYTLYPSECGLYDDDDFKSLEMCCVCGGGSTA